MSKTSKGVATIIAGFWQMLVWGTLTCWGLYISYIASWLRVHDSLATYNTLTVVVGISQLWDEIGLLFGGWLKNRYGARFTLFVGSFCLGGGMVIASLYANVFYFMFWYGMVFGLGAGINKFVVPRQACLYWPNHKGKVTGLIFIGFGLSPLVFGGLFTILVNPDNRSPSEKISQGVETYYYFPSEVYNRVPMTMQIIGALYFSITFVSTFFVFPLKQDQVSSGSQERLNQTSCDLSVRQALRTPQFMQMFVMMYCWMSFGIYVYLSFKNVGAKSISSDHLLTIVGLIGSAFNSCFRFVWPSLLDYTSFKVSSSMMWAFQLISAIALPLTVSLIPAFFILTVMGFATAAYSMGTFAVLTSSVFGPLTGDGVFLWVMIAMVLSAFVPLFVNFVLVDYLGYTYAFMFYAVQTAIGLVIALRFDQSRQSIESVSINSETKDDK